jgi:hypothetical protein
MDHSEVGHLLVEEVEISAQRRITQAGGAYVFKR